MTIQLHWFRPTYGDSPLIPGVPILTERGIFKVATV